MIAIRWRAKVAPSFYVWLQDYRLLYGPDITCELVDSSCIRFLPTGLLIPTSNPFQHKLGANRPWETVSICSIGPADVIKERMKAVQALNF